MSDNTKEVLKQWLVENRLTRIGNSDKHLSAVDGQFIVYPARGEILLKTENFDEAYEILMERKKQ